jgi:hypothetical protein
LVGLTPERNSCNADPRKVSVDSLRKHFYVKRGKSEILRNETGNVF